MFPASATNNLIQVKRSLSKPQPPGWSRGRKAGLARAQNASRSIPLAWKARFPAHGALGCALR
jgi:hypothetical protein